jgi:hypothetical protein
VSHLCLLRETAQHETCPRVLPVCDTAFIRSSVALRAPPRGITSFVMRVWWFRTAGLDAIFSNLSVAVSMYVPRFIFMLRYPNVPHMTANHLRIPSPISDHRSAAPHRQTKKSQPKPYAQTHPNSNE